MMQSRPKKYILKNEWIVEMFQNYSNRPGCRFPRCNLSKRLSPGDLDIWPVLRPLSKTRPLVGQHCPPVFFDWPSLEQFAWT